MGPSTPWSWTLPRRQPHGFCTREFRGIGVEQSTNGGQNWMTILNKATPAVATKMTAGGYTGFTKVVVALAPPTSPANPGGIRVLYASMVGTPNVFGALTRSVSF